MELLEMYSKFVLAYISFGRPNPEIGQKMADGLLLF